MRPVVYVLIGFAAAIFVAAVVAQATRHRRYARAGNMLVEGCILTQHLHDYKVEADAMSFFSTGSKLAAGHPIGIYLLVEDANTRKKYFVFMAVDIEWFRLNEVREGDRVFVEGKLVAETLPRRYDFAVKMAQSSDFPVETTKSGKFKTEFIHARKIKTLPQPESQ